MKRIFALILLFIQIGMLALPSFLVMTICNTSEKEENEVKVPYFHSSDQLLVGDSSYLMAILERATNKKCKNETTPPVNTADLSPSVYTLPSSLSLNIISRNIKTRIFHEIVFIQSIFQDVLTPPPKLS